MLCVPFCARLSARLLHVVWLRPLIVLRCSNGLLVAYSVSAFRPSVCPSKNRVRINGLFKLSEGCRFRKFDLGNPSA